MAEVIPFATVSITDRDIDFKDFKTAFVFAQLSFPPMFAIKSWPFGVM
nr:MAG: hypothetical protein [Bacteriophage sp.]DAN03086.1 MAG TPA: hypothetical protein [Caudoviricetes sp.]